MFRLPTVALIDGDVLVYRIGWAFNDESLTSALIAMRKLVHGVCSVVGARVYEGYLTGSGQQFRHVVATTQPYKGNRKAEKPLHYTALREYMTTHLGFEVTQGEEADDVLGIRLNQLGEEAVVCTPGKDLNNVPGWHHSTKAEDLLYWVTPQQAKINFARQVLTGDAIDNIPGLYAFTGVKCGPVLASTLVPDDTPPHLLQGIVYTAYMEANGTPDMADEAASLLWIRQQYDQLFEWSLLI